ncbi:hypothetical protein GLOIN_2v1486279 [Rhizophagus clarus]|nr:hypothetical protein GLOIN_2v1486279 [Rhizophagus clarus]
MIHPDYKYKPNRPKSTFKAPNYAKKKSKKANGNVNTNITSNTNNPSHNPDQMNVDLAIFQPFPPTYLIQNDIADPQLMQNQYGCPLLISAYPTPSDSPISSVVNDYDLINNSEGFPFDNIPYTLYPDDLSYSMANLFFDGFN